MVKRLMNVEEFASAVGLSQSAIYKLIEKGKLPHIRVGKAIRFSEKHLESLNRNIEQAG